MTLPLSDQFPNIVFASQEDEYIETIEIDFFDAFDISQIIGNQDEEIFISLIDGTPADDNIRIIDPISNRK